MKALFGRCLGSRPDAIHEMRREDRQPAISAEPSGSAAFPLSARARGNESLPPRHGHFPADARLHWPDGRTTKGRVERSAAGADFSLDPGSSIIQERLKKKGKRDTHLAEPRPLPAVPAGEHWAPLLPSLSELDSLKGGRTSIRLRLAGTPPRESDIAIGTLALLANVAGGREGGSDDTQDMLVAMFLADCTKAIAAHCTNPRAALNAAEALSAPLLEIRFKGGPSYREAYGNVGGVIADLKYGDFQSGELTNEVALLEPGEHRFINISHEDRTKAHAMALSLTRLSRDIARITVINSNGWPNVPQHGNRMAASKRLSMEDACMALESLISGEMPLLDGSGRRSKWQAAEEGMPLLAWLKSAGPSSTKLENNFHGTHFKTVPQKGGDCAIESKLAWLSTVMPLSDYKLAKAAFLGCLKELAETHGVLHPRAAKRLNERITASLSGSAVAPQ